MPLSPTDQAKIDALKAQTLAGEGVNVCEVVGVTWPEPDGLVYYSSVQADEIYPDIVPHLGGAPVDVRLRYADDAPVREVVHESGISDDTIDLDFWDADGAISDLAHTHGAGVRVEVFYYYADVDLFLSMWWGHMQPADSADMERYKATAEQGFRSAELPLPRRAFYTGCQAVFGGLLTTQAEIDEGDCPYNAHLTEEERDGAPLVGNLDPDTSEPYASCPRTKEASVARIGDALSFLAFDSTIESIVNNQTKGPALLSTSRGNENNLKRPLRVVAGKRTVRDLDLLAFTPQLNTNHPELGFVRTLFAVSEGRNRSVTRAQVNDEIFPPDQVQVRLGEKRQAPTGFSPGVGNYSGTSLFFGVYGQVDPEDYSDPDSLKGQAVVEGHDEVRVYTDPDDPTVFTEEYSTDRAWWLAHMLRHKRWGLGVDTARLDLDDMIALAAWGSSVVTFTNEDGQVFSGRRTDFNAELTDRTAQQQINDLCLAGRFGLPFPQFGKLRVVPLRKLTEEELDDAPVFADYGDSRNILVDEAEKSSVVRSQMSDKELPNRVVLTFDDAARGNIQRPLTFEDVTQQLRAGRSFGDTSRRVVEKKFTALGVTTFDEAARLGHYLRDLGPFDEGGLRNNLRVTFRTWHTLALDLHKYQVIKVLSHQLERYGFEYFRIRHIRQLPDLKVEISCQAYADTYAGDEEVALCSPGDAYDVVWTGLDGFDLEEGNELSRSGGTATALGSRTYDPLRCTHATWTVADTDHCKSWWVVFEDLDGGNQYGWFFNLFLGVLPVAARVEDGVPNAGNSFFSIDLPKTFRIYLNQGDVELQMESATPGVFTTIYTFPVPTGLRYRLKAYATGSGSLIPNIEVSDSEGPFLGGSVTADAGADKSAALGEQVLLDGSNSSASGTEIASFDWEFVSGPVGVSILGTGATRLVRPAEVGTYVFRLTVYGERGAVGSDTVTVTVSDIEYMIDRDDEQLYEGDFESLYELGES